MNETLMKTVPHTYLADLADKICKEGKSHHYLALFAAITNVGDKNIPKNQFEIAKLLASKSRFSKISQFLSQLHESINVAFQEASYI
jgi:hypothetical protein